MPTLEVIATAFGLANIWLTIRRSLYCWPAGLAMVSLYFVVFSRQRLYSQAALQLFFATLQVYGWLHWRRTTPAGERIQVERLPLLALALYCLAAGAGAVALGRGMEAATDAAYPYADATVTALSVLAQWMMARKLLESWWVWIAVDVVAIGLYLATGLVPTAVLYAAFLLLCIRGFFEWRAAVVPEAA
jgi:nicotinamide mononucleotide transporter